MSRHRDYQPTIDRARSQAEIAQRREAKLREKKDECHREMLRAQAAARIANEEADALRDRILGMEQSARDLRRENANLRSERESLYAIAADMRQQLEALDRTSWRRIAERVRGAFRNMLRIGA